jgi:Na+/H+ antiporter NhaD/arsenite permease-like protein
VRRRRERSARSPDPQQVHDIVTPTEREQRERGIVARRRRYFTVMVPCIVLVLFGFFVPAPIPVRVVALAVASLLPPVAAILGNR